MSARDRQILSERAVNRQVELCENAVMRRWPSRHRNIFTCKHFKFQTFQIKYTFFLNFSCYPLAIPGIREHAVGTQIGVTGI